MTDWLLGACVALLIVDAWVTRKWLRVSKECLRAIEAQTKYIADALERGKDAP